MKHFLILILVFSFVGCGSEEPRTYPEEHLLKKSDWQVFSSKALKENKVNLADIKKRAGDPIKVAIEGNTIHLLYEYVQRDGSKGKVIVVVDNAKVSGVGYVSKVNPLPK